jgi:hypothetical protein
MIIFHIALACLAGLVGHQAKRLTDRLPDGLGRIANYTLGSFLCLPFATVIHRDLKDMRDGNVRFIIAYLLAFLGVGAGTVLGWLGWVELPESSGYTVPDE